MKSSKAEECDGKENSITIQLAPLGISVFSCTPTEPEKKEKPAKTKKTTHSTKNVKEKAEKPAEKPAKRNAPAKKAEADLQSMMAEAAAVFNEGGAFLQDYQSVLDCETTDGIGRRSG